MHASLSRLKQGLRFFFGIAFSRLFGFFRDILMAFFFGSNFITDAFTLAFKIPNVFRQVFGESMYERAFMPPFNRLRSEGKLKEARRLLLRTFLISQILVIVCMTLVYFFLPFIIDKLAAGFEEDAQGLPLELARLFMPYMLLISLATFCGSILRYTKKKEFLYGFSPAVQNMLLLITMILFYKSLGIVSMVYGYLIGSVGFLLVQLPSVIKIYRDLGREEDVKESKGFSKGETKKAFGQGGNILASSLFNKSIDLVDAAVATLTVNGAVTALMYSRRILDLPVTLFGMAFSSLPVSKAVSDLKGKKKGVDIPAAIAMGVKTQFILMVPISVFCLIYGHELMTLFFKRGEFDEQALKLTSVAFFFFSIGLFPMSLRRFFAEIFPAIEDSRPLIYVSFIGAVVNISLDLMLYRTFLGHGGIALATSISYVVQCMVMIYLLKRASVNLRGQGIGSFVSKSSVAIGLYALAMGGIKLALPEDGNFFFLLAVIILIGGIGLVVFLAVTLPFLIKRSDKKLRVILSGGGTGGHVYPSLAIFDILSKHEEIEDVCYLGMKTKPEYKIVTKKGIAFRGIRSAPVAGISAKSLFHSFPNLVMGTLQAMKHILAFNPSLVIVSGGYVSAPVVFAAALLQPFLKLKIVLHEQNLAPGFMNKAASLLVDLSMVNFRESAFLMWNNKCVHVGYPVRKEFLLPKQDANLMKQKLGIPSDRFLVLAYGGSIGARTINRSFVQALPKFAQSKKFYLVHGIGMNQSSAYHALNDTRALLEEMDFNFDPEAFKGRDNDGEVFYEGHAYLHNLCDYQRAADLIVCRAGAGALAEIMALGKPALVIPKRGLPGDHQELNAIELRAKGACELLFESYSLESNTEWVDPDALFKTVLSLAGKREELLSMSKHAGASFYSNTEHAVANAIADCFHERPLNHITQITEPASIKHQRLFDSLVSHLEEQPSDHVMVQYYRSKLEGYLRSSHFLQVNKGIKLIGVFKDPQLYNYIYENFDQFKGFLKRNSLFALAKAVSYQPEFETMVLKGLDDSYFETRLRAIGLYRRFYRELNRQRAICDKIHSIALNKRESYEVRSDAIAASVLFLNQTQYIDSMNKFLFARNVRLREGVLRGVELGIKENRFDNFHEVSKFLKQMLLTNSDFQAHFHIRDQFKNTAVVLRQATLNKSRSQVKEDQ